MTKILGTTLKVNSIDIFPNTVGKSNHYVRVNDSENRYELIDNETLQDELPTNEDCWSSIASANSYLECGTTTRCDESLRYSLNCQPIPENVFNGMWLSDPNQTYPLEIGSYGDYSKGLYRFEFDVLENTSTRLQLQVEDENGTRYLLEEFNLDSSYNYSLISKYYYIGIDFKYWYIQILDGGNKASLGNAGMFVNQYDNTTIVFNEPWDIVFGNGIKKHFETLPEVVLKPTRAFYKVTNGSYPLGRYLIKLTKNNASVTPYIRIRSNNEEDWREVFSTNDMTSLTYLSEPFEDTFTQISVPNGYTYIVYKEEDYEELSWYNRLIAENNGDIIFNEERFNIFVKEDGTTYASKDLFVRQTNEPSNPENGLRWVDTAQLPIRSYRYDNGWKRCSDVLISSVSLYQGYMLSSLIREPTKYNGTHIYRDTCWEYDLPVKSTGELAIVYHNLNIQDTSKYKVTIIKDMNTEVTAQYFLGKNTVGIIAPNDDYYTVKLEVME